MRARPRTDALPAIRDAFVALGALVALLTACSSDPSEHIIRVDLRTDYSPGVEFDVVRLQIGDGDVAFRSDHLVREGADFVRGERIDETMVQAGQVPLTVTLYRAGAPVATRRVSAIVESGITVVTVVMTRSCEGVECPNDNPLFDSCLGGRCVDPRCTVETPEFCPAAACTGAMECSVVACAEPACESSVCFSIPDDSRCASDERCDAILGCTPVGTIRDSGVDAEPLDAGVDAPVMDASVDAFDGGPDALDAGLDVFDGGTDAGLPRACPGVDDDTVFLFDFESSADAVTGMNGIDERTGRVAGGSPCGGEALDVPTMGLSYFYVPNRATFDLAEGSIDFWFKSPAFTGFETLLDRDARDRFLPGHFGVYFTDEGEIVVRNQEPGLSDSGACSGAGVVPTDTWVRVGIHFGPGGVAIFVNGVRRSRTGSYMFAVDSVTGCDRVVVGGIEGNANPFVFGANSGLSAEGDHLPIRRPFEGLQLDHVRLSSVLRDYESEVYP